MYLSSKQQARTQQLIVTCVVAFAWPAQLGFAAEKAPLPSAESAEKPATPAAALTTPQAEPASAATAVSASSKTKEPIEWVYNMRANFGAARSAKVSSEFSSDRMGGAIFAGYVLPDFELPLGFVKTKEFTAGLAYSSFTGVDVVSDKNWSLQSIGAQARVILDLGLSQGMDIATHAGVAAQVLVGEEQRSRQNAVKYGFALTGASFVRWPLMDSVYVLGGVDVTLGTASSFAAAAGLETNF